MDAFINPKGRIPRVARGNLLNKSQKPLDSFLGLIYHELELSQWILEKLNYYHQIQILRLGQDIKDR